jgi:hypothetical protein
MPIIRMISGRLALGAAFLACLMFVAGCAQSQPAPTATAAAMESDSASAVLQAYREYGGDVVPMDATTPSVTVDVADLTGTIAAYSLTGGDPPCTGFVRTAPSLVFTLASDAPALQVAFAGNQASNLIVVQEGEEIVCPEIAAATNTPEITLDQPKAGRYGVWVGRIDMDKPVDGKLTVTLAQ